MNYVLARSQYAESQKAQVSDLSDPHEIVLVTMRELRKSLAAIAHSPKRSATNSRHYAKAFTAVYILQSSLNFDQGGEIAINLFRLYEYFRQQLTSAYSGKSDNQLDQCVVLLDEIIEAWAGMP